MPKYKVNHIGLPTKSKLDKWNTCKKVREYSGSLRYKITKDYTLLIENIEAVQRGPSEERIPGSHAQSFDFKSILNSLDPDQDPTKVSELLCFEGDYNNVGFVCAVLIDLGNVEKV